MTRSSLASVTFRLLQRERSQPIRREREFYPKGAKRTVLSAKYRNRDAAGDTKIERKTIHYQETLFLAPYYSVWNTKKESSGIASSWEQQTHTQKITEQRNTKNTKDSPTKIKKF